MTEEKPEAIAGQDREADGGPTPTPRDNIVETTHTAILGGEEVSYRVTAGTWVLREETADREKPSEGETAKASLFFVAYVRDDVADRSSRPITFSFNGGPGSSSVWLHLGLLGPRRVAMEEDGGLPAPPFRLTENPHSALAQTDLVFIDPVSTGYSRPVEGQKAKEYHGFEKDIASVGDFIRLYCTRNTRWTSPKYLIGESYGTTRAAELSGYLQQRHGMFLNGVLLVSSVLDFGTLQFLPGNDLPYVLFLPTYAATAHYHGRVRTRRSLPRHLKAAETFATDVYAPALAKGARLSSRERKDVADGLARLTGLSVDFVQRCDLRVEIFRFAKELLRHERRTVGRLDSRFQGIDRDAAGERPEYDPSLANITGPYTATLYDYVRGDLRYESDLPYEVLNEKVWPWSYEGHQNRYVNVAETLRKTMSRNVHLRVFVASGTYDLATPYFATRYTLDHLGLDRSLADNIVSHTYEAGHMMYIHGPSLARLAADIAAFVAPSGRRDRT